MKCLEIPLYYLHTLNLNNKNTIKKITICENEFDLSKEYFAIKISFYERNMMPKYLQMDEIIVQINNRTADIDNKDCILKVDNNYFLRHINIQNDYLITTVYDKSNNEDYTYTNDEIITKPVEIIGIVKQIRRNM